MAHKKIIYQVIFSTALVFLSCFSCFSQGAWTQKANFSGAGRTGAIGFSIGTKGYIGLGDIGSNAIAKDLWEWDQSTNMWTQKANFPSVGRLEAAAFAIGTKGYVGTGYDGNFYKDDFYEYDPAANVWTAKANLPQSGPQSGRAGAVGFAIGNKGYMGLGADGNGPNQMNNDLYQYDPATNSWGQIAHFTPGGRTYASAFSIGTKGYVACGYGQSGCEKDLWEWNQATNIWTRKVDMGAGITQRQKAAGFSMNGKGYVGPSAAGNFATSFWEYDPAIDHWQQRAYFAGTAREGAVGFSIGGKGYIGTGDDGTKTKDFWEYDLSAATGMEETENQNMVSVFPNPAKDFISVNYSLGENERVKIELFSINGNKIDCLLNEEQSSGEKNRSINLSHLNLEIGIYFIKIAAGGNETCKKLTVIK